MGKVVGGRGWGFLMSVAGGGINSSTFPARRRGSPVTRARWASRARLSRQPLPGGLQSDYARCHARGLSALNGQLTQSQDARFGGTVELAQQRVDAALLVGAKPPGGPADAEDAQGERPEY